MFRLGVFFLVASFYACKNNNSNRSYVVKMNLVKSIVLSEKEKKIGKLTRAFIASDSLIYILDRTSFFIHQYEFSGNYVKSFGGRGSSPHEFPNPVDFCIDENNKELLVTQYQMDLRVHKLDSQKTYSFFLSDDNVMLAAGDLYVIKDSLIAMTSFYDAKDDKHSLCVIDKKGNVIERFYFIPNENLEYVLDTESPFDLKENGNFALSFSQSPAILLGNIFTKEIRKYDFEEMRDKYISKKRKKDSMSRFEEMIELLKEEALNYKVLFLNDSIVVRASSMYSEKSISDKSYLSRKNKQLDFFQISDEKVKIIANKEIQGKLHCVFNGHLAIEESDEPDNRRFGLYKVEFSTPTP